MAQEYRQNESYETIKKGYSSPTLEITQNESDSSTSNRYSLPFGLCKGVGIDTTGMTPREAWDAYTDKTGISKEQAEKKHWGKETTTQDENNSTEQSNNKNPPKNETIDKRTEMGDVSAKTETTSLKDRKFSSTLGAINEGAAQRAKEMTSFFDYKKGSATSEYQNDVARFDANVNALIERYKNNNTLTDEDWDRVERIAGAYAKNRADFTNDYNRIRGSYPSWAIAGPAKYNVSKHQKKMNALDNLFSTRGANIDPDNNEYLNKIKGILSNASVKSNDSNAIGKLQAKYDGLKAELERGKQMNAYFRKNKTLVGFPGVSDEAAKDFDKRNASGDYFAHQPYAAYRLQNGNAELKRLQGRIDSLNAIKTASTSGEDSSSKYPTVKGVSVQENAEQMRVQLRFEGKPDEATRTMLKSNGFRWSPSQNAWQRQLTGNGKYAAKQVMQKLSERGE